MPELQHFLAQIRGGASICLAPSVMHPRNPYRNGVDFAVLARQFEPLSTHLKHSPDGRQIIDFNDEAAQRELTKAILKCDYKLDLELPADRLCPPVPNRLNYVLWIQDLVREISTSRLWAGDGDKAGVRGLDVGTGASAIYPLLACSLDETWTMIATELDEASYTCAKANVDRNSVGSRIDVYRVDGARIFEPLYHLQPSEQIDFSMCNPPFYSSKDEVDTLRTSKEELPAQVCTGGELEMIYPPPPSSEEDWEKEGGEVAFVGRMVMESLQLRAKCRWYTSMLGRLSSVPKVEELLRRHDITNYIITKFVQGRTRRWAIGWSFEPWRVSDAVGRLSYLPASHAPYKSQPPRSTLHHSLPPLMPTKALEAALEALADGTRFLYTPFSSTAESKDDGSGFQVKASTAVWSRAERRKRKRKSDDHDDGEPPLKKAKVESTSSAVSPKVAKRGNDSEQDFSEWTMICTVRLVRGASTPPNQEMMDLELQWVYGRDRMLFESFSSHISQRLYMDGSRT
ncbi:methyltransferase 10 domain-containing protein [Coprinopsis sp. MPI-PUGE-AT-0042]|nr:methyltransferase 10 domain-containing protein [Coprinopsis sp. MPI-PUGE-AT-0042]